ncbi:MAG: hypothetical protein ACYDC2_04480 [Solirubrobacteraceae bacterium]
MIVAVCTDDDALVACAQEAAQQQPVVFGRCYRVFDRQIPVLGLEEPLFISAHGAYRGDENNPVIGDRDADLYLDGVTALRELRRLFPVGYRGSVYISACEAADHSNDDFSFAEVFKAQLQGALPQAGPVYAQQGVVGLRVPPPNDPAWIRV